AAGDVHLPEAVLRGYVALREVEIIEVRSRDVRDANSVAGDGNRLGQAGSTEGAVKLRQCRARRKVEPQGATERSGCSQREKRCQYRCRSARDTARFQGRRAGSRHWV